MMAVATVLWVLVGSAVVGWLYWIRAQRLPKPAQGLEPFWPFLGNVLDMFRWRDEPLDLMLWLDRRFKRKPWTLGSPIFVPFVHTSDPRNVKHVLKDNFFNYEKGPRFREMFGDVLGHGVFNSDGLHWIVQRKAASPMFNAKTMRTTMMAVWIKHAKTLHRMLAEEPEDIDMQRRFFEFTIDSIGQIAFGVDLQTLGKESNQECAAFARSFDRAQQLMERRLTNPLWHIGKVFPFFGGERELKDHVRVLNSFVYRLIDQRRKEHDYLQRSDILSRFMTMAHHMEKDKQAKQHTAATSTAAGASGGDSTDDDSDDGDSAESLTRGERKLVEMLQSKGVRQGTKMARRRRLQRRRSSQRSGSVSSVDGDSSDESESAPVDIVIDDKYLRDVVLNFMIAGRDTTAVTLSWTLFELSRNPDMQAEMARELARQTRGFAHDSREFFDSLSSSSLIYTTGFINEVLRRYPPVPRDMKSAVHDDVWPDGTVVKAGSFVSYSPLLLAHNEQVFKDPHKFDPMRFLNKHDDGTYELKPALSPFALPIFNAGPRTCIGQRMAMLEVKLLLSFLIPDYEFRLSDNHENNPPKQRRLPDELSQGDTQVPFYQPTITFTMNAPLRMRVTKRKPMKNNN
eukprot:TRINITY_DN56214_c0_g1_i1.p1 TRINITY_DN56214_c0_g1~~TRINITY_DN56214_c0_g1_i1.p1  ORF type:complete len:625 (+),score=308.98 TRINITY_DN56214_c0_g1_i1:27-1901(+)